MTAPALTAVVVYPTSDPDMMSTDMEGPVLAAIRSYEDMDYDGEKNLAVVRAVQPEIPLGKYWRWGVEQVEDDLVLLLPHECLVRYDWMYDREPYSCIQDDLPLAPILITRVGYLTS